MSKRGLIRQFETMFVKNVLTLLLRLLFLDMSRHKPQLLNNNSNNCKKTINRAYIQIHTAVLQNIRVHYCYYSLIFLEVINEMQNPKKQQYV